MKPSTLTPEQFIAWRRSLGMSQGAAANRLHISVASVSSYETGFRKRGASKNPSACRAWYGGD